MTGPHDSSKPPGQITAARTAWRAFSSRCGIHEHDHTHRIAFFAGVAWAAARVTTGAQEMAKIAAQETKIGPSDEEQKS